MLKQLRATLKRLRAPLKLSCATVKHPFDAKNGSPSVLSVADHAKTSRFNGELDLSDGGMRLCDAQASYFGGAHDEFTRRTTI